jgi:hypothetical protein
MKKLGSHQRKGLSPAIIASLILGCTIGLVSIVYIMGQHLRPQPDAQIEAQTGNAAIEAQVTLIATQFICACGDCSGESLEKCSCNVAKKARQTIRESIQAGRSPGDIMATIDRSFGGRKADSAFAQSGLSTTGSLTALRTEVLSHFRCPCGKCGMENLAECECQHPRGAKEVRAFLDKKLATAEIEKAYGGKKF